MPDKGGLDFDSLPQAQPSGGLDFNSLPQVAPTKSVGTTLDFNSLPSAAAKFGHDYAPDTRTPEEIQAQDRASIEARESLGGKLKAEGAAIKEDILHPSRIGHAFSSAAASTLGDIAHGALYVAHDLPQQAVVYGAGKGAAMGGGTPEQQAQVQAEAAKAYDAFMGNLTPFTPSPQTLQNAAQFATEAGQNYAPEGGSTTVGAVAGLPEMALGATPLGRALMVSQSLGHQANEAQQAGATPLQQLGAAGIGTIGGLVQTGYLGRLGSAGIKSPSLYDRLVAHTLTGAGVMAGPQFAENAYARATYDPTRNLGEGVGQQGIMGGLLGLGGGLVHERMSAAAIKAQAPAEAPTPMPQTHSDTLAFLPSDDGLPAAQAQHQGRWEELEGLRAKQGTPEGLTPEEEKRYIALDKAVRTQGQVGAGSQSLVIPGMYSNEAMAHMDRSGDLGPVHASIDMDNFKALNETLGHRQTDYMIQQVGTRLAQDLPEGTVIGRGATGDEFIIRGADPEAIRQHLEAVSNDLKGQTIQIVDQDGNVRQVNGFGLSFGIGGTPDEAESALTDHKQEKLDNGERYTRAQVEEALAASAADRRAAKRGESVERRGTDYGPAGRAIPTFVRAAEPGEHGFVGPAPFGGAAEGNQVPVPVEVGAGGAEGGQPSGTGAGAGAQGTEAAESPEAAGGPGVGSAARPSEAPGSFRAEAAEEVGPKSFSYFNGNGEKVEVPLNEPHHADAYQAIEDEFQRKVERIKDIKGDDLPTKKLRAQLYKQAGDDRAYAKAALHLQMTEEELSQKPQNAPESIPAWKPEETEKLNAPAGSPEAHEAEAKLNEPVKRFQETSKTEGVPAQKTGDIGYQYEQARGQETVDAINARAGLKDAMALSPEDQSRLRDAVEDPRIQLPPYLEKFKNAVVEPLRASILKNYLELKQLKGEPPHAIQASEDVAHATRRALPDFLVQQPKWWQRALNLRSFDPGERAQEFRLKGLPTTERSEQARTYKSLTDAKGNRRVVHVEGRGQLEDVKTGEKFKRTSYSKAVQDRLEGPAKKVDRLLEKARTAFEEVTQKLPSRLVRQAEKLEAEGKGRAEVIKRIISRSLPKSARAMRDLLSERHEIEHALQIGDRAFFHEHNEGLKDQEESLRNAVNKEFWKQSDALGKEVEKAEAKLEKARANAKTPSGKIYDLENELDRARQAHREQLEADAAQDPAQVIDSNEDLKAKQAALQDAFKKTHDRLLAGVDSRIKQELARDARNNAFISAESEKATQKRYEATGKQMTADVEEHKYDHLGEEEAMRKAAEEHPRMANALAKLEAAQKELEATQAKLGKMDPNARYYEAKDGSLLRQTEARTREIEAATPTRYDKNYLNNLWEQSVNLNKAIRNLKLVQSWQRTPEQGGFGYKIPEGKDTQKLPEGYRRTTLQIPGMDKWAFPDKMALALDHLQLDLERSKSIEDVTRAGQAINRLFVRSIFLSPVGHIFNTGYHYIANKGFGIFNPAEQFQSIKGLATAFKQIIGMDPRVQKLMNEGAPMMLQNPQTVQLHDELHTALQAQLGHLTENDPKLVKWASRIGVYPKAALQALSEASSNVLWMVDDAMRMEAIEKLKHDHPEMSTKEAVEQVAKGIADYRSAKGMPIALRKFAENPNLFMFSRYHQFRSWSFFHDLKNAFLPKAEEGKLPLQVQQEAMGKLAAIALLAAISQTVLSPIYQKITSDKEAKAPMSGPLAMIQMLSGTAGRTEAGSKVLGGLSPQIREAIYGGPRTGFQNAQDFFTLAPGASIGIQQLTGRNDFSGQQLSPSERARVVGNAISPVSQFNTASRNPHSAWSNLMTSFGARYKGTPATETAKSIAREAYGTAAQSDLDTEAMEQKLNIASALYGKSSQEAAALKNQLVDDAVKSGALTRKQAMAKVESAVAPPEKQLANLVGTFKGPNAGQQAMQVYRVATDDEKKQLAPVVQKKLSQATLGANARAQNADLLKEFKALQAQVH